MMGVRNGGIAVLVLAAALAGCGGSAGSGAPAVEEAPGSGRSQEARTLPIPGGELPAGHPDVGDATQAPGMVWTPPEDWIAETPASAMRLAQYRVPGTAGDGECVVFYFGPGQGGAPMANAERWAGQFSQPDGGSSLDLMQVTELTSTQVPVLMVEVTGTYNGGMTMATEPAPAMPGWMLLGAIAKGSDAPWFFKLTGPEATLREHRDAFVTMMESIRTGS